MEVLAETYEELDDFGRTVEEGRVLPDGSISQKVTTWDVEGRMLTESEWGNTTKKTTYSNYDPFGRAKTITPPEGSGHRMDFDYEGNQKVTTTVRRALNFGCGSPR